MHQHYELVFLLRLSTPEAEAAKLNEFLKKTISEQGVVAKFGEIGNRKLAFPIKKEEHAIYWLYEFDAEPTVVQKLHHELSLHEHVLRFLIVTTKPKTQEDIDREERMKQSIERAKLKEGQKEKETARIKKAAETPEETKPIVEKEKISLEELDKKLDELLDDDSIKT